MKKVLLSTLVCMSSYLFAQSPSSCANALYLTKDSSYTITSAGSNWFELLATDSTMIVTLADASKNGGFRPVMSEIKTNCATTTSIVDSITHFFRGGVLEFKNLLPSTLYKLRIDVGGVSDTFLVK